MGAFAESCLWVKVFGGAPPPVPEDRWVFIRSSAATATVTLVPLAAVTGASALARAKRRGHVACPQASLSTRSSAHRRERDECATLPASRQEQGMGRHAPTPPPRF